MTTSRGASKSALLIIMLSAVVSWVLFVASVYIDTVTGVGEYTGFGSEATYLSSAELGWADSIRFSPYLIFAAIMVLAFGALLAKRRLLALERTQPTVSNLVRPTRGFSSSVLIIALAFAAVTAIFTFLGGFFEPTGDTQILPRVINLYLPILLLTALAVATLLAGFILHRPVPAPKNQTLLTAETTPLRAESREYPSSVAGATSSSQRSTALAFTVPIVSVATALILGLIVYDLTQTNLQVWVWVVIQAIIAIGIILGTRFARHGQEAHAASGMPPGGTSEGARILNFALSIVFAAIVALMSLTYGAGAVENLQVRSDLSLAVYGDNEAMLNDDSMEMQLTGALVSVNGSGLNPHEQLSVVLEPRDSEVVAATVERDGYAYGEAEWPANLDAGDYELVVEGTTSDNRDLRVTLEVYVTDEGTLQFPNGSDTYSGDEDVRQLPVTPAWLFADLLPALLLLMLAAATVYVTLVLRHPDVPAPAIRN